MVRPMDTPETTPDIDPDLVDATFTVEVAPSVTAPDNSPLSEKKIAPFDADVPFIVSGSAEVTTAATSSVAPLATVVVERVDPDSPSAAAFVIRVVPAVILVEPV